MITETTKLGGLFSKTMLLLALSMGLSALGTLAGAGITSVVAIVALAIAFLAGAFVVPVLAAQSRQRGIAGLGLWCFISGLFLGPCIAQYVAILGLSTVLLAYAGSAGVMAVCGLIASFSGLNFSKLESWLTMALFGLIIFGVVNLFVSFGHVGTIIYALIGMAVFVGFFLVDFFRVATGDDSWAGAVMCAMQLYLDYVNFLLYLLRFLAAVVGKKDD